MWALLWNLWFRGHTTRVIPEMNFSWATDSIERVQELPIFHNAGVGAENQGGELFFYKGKYHQGMDPLLDRSFIEAVIRETPNKGTAYYAQALLDLKQKYNLTY
jgi:hypothetical protein